MDKLTASHLARSAYVYVRQSTPRQVRENLESRRRQYGLAERARVLGFSRVEIVDDDLGTTGSGTRERPGFVRLLAAVCAGGVGAVLAAEASRLARNSRDWHHLIDLCALTLTVLVDHDGIYDPKLLNDRLLLGLKGTISEYELGLMRQRAHAARRQAIERGEVLFQVPVGYVRTEDRRYEMTPDAQVQAAIRRVFAKYFELGSARQVLLWHRQEQIPLPVAKAASGGREVIWRLPAYSRVHAILTNPVYAGAFVHGRRQAKTRVVDGRARKSAGHVVPESEWRVLLRDHHPAYIDWESYQRIRRQMRENARMSGRMTKGAPRQGKALLSGLLRCARCGRRFFVGYSGTKHSIVRYSCSGAHIQAGLAPCISFAGRRVDEAVVRAVLAALAPEGMKASVTAWEALSRSQGEATRQLELAAERSRYEAERAKRQYDRVEPENRLVAGELERRWNEALAGLEAAEARLAEGVAQERPVTEGERARLSELGRDLEAAWNHPAASPSLKKRILRTVLVEVVADIADDPPRIELKLHWAGGVHTSLSVGKNRTGRHGRSTDRTAIDLLRELAKICADDRIAQVLNRLGMKTGTGRSWTAGRVRGHRLSRKIPMFDREAPRTWVTMTQAAAELGLTPYKMRGLLKSKVLPSRQVVRCAPWVIERADLELPAVREAVKRLKAGKKAPRKSLRQESKSLFSTS